MTKQEFKDLAASQVLVLDGACGTNLMRRGMPRGACVEAWISEHLDVARQLLEEYVEAGSKVLYAPTFSANRIKLWEHGIMDRLEELNRELVRVTKEAAGNRALVAGDLTMSGAHLEPLGELSFRKLIDIYKEQIEILVDAGVDLLVVETMLGLQETRAAVLAAQAVCDLPIIATLSFGEDGSTLYGTGPASAVVTLQGMGVDAVGVNCSVGPDKLLPIIQSMREYATVPLVAKPNAGEPRILADGSTGYDMDAETFAGCITRLVDAGAGIVGGCCGTTPEFIDRAAKAVAGKAVPPIKGQDKIYLASDREVYAFAPGQRLRIGWGIDFSQKEKLVEDYKAEAFETAIAMAMELEGEDTDIIAYCTDAEGIDAAKASHEVAEELSRAVQKPLVLVSDSLETISYALEHFTGIMALKWKNTQDGTPVNGANGANGANDTSDKNGTGEIGIPKEFEAEIKNMAKRYQVPLVTLDNELIYC